jgi:hypothetical protein
MKVTQWLRCDGDEIAATDGVPLRYSAASSVGAWKQLTGLSETVFML